MQYEHMDDIFASLEDDSHIRVVVHRDRYITFDIFDACEHNLYISRWTFDVQLNLFFSYIYILILAQFFSLWMFMFYVVYMDFLCYCLYG